MSHIIVEENGDIEKEVPSSGFESKLVFTPSNDIEPWSDIHNDDPMHQGEYLPNGLTFIFD